MLYKHLFALFTLGLITVSTVRATENTELIDKVAALTESEISRDELAFQTFSSCDEMSTTLTKFIKDNFSAGQRNNYMLREASIDGEMPFPTSAVATDNAVVGGAAEEGKDMSLSTDHSVTNIQVAGVDEPELLKSDGDYIYYYNERLGKVFVISSPLDRISHAITMSQAKIVAIIALPKTISQVQLFVRPNQLVLLGQRYVERSGGYTLLDSSSKTEIITYDMSDKTTPKLMKFADLDGRYQDARLVGNKLYVVSQLGINRWWYPQMYKTVDDIRVDTEALLPKVIDVSYTKDASKKNLVINETAFPYQVTVARPNCTDISYVLPTKESISEYGLTPQFTLLRAVDLDLPETKVQTTTTFGTTQTIHLTEKSVYLASPFWAPYGSRCPVGAMCIWGGGGDQQTLLHKLALQGTKMSYVNSVLLPGSPLTQWSMDEDSSGNFRILTSTRDPQQATHLLTLNPQLKQLGALKDIEPGEQFKASRFMGDKLYLVTFEQIDPLFVIDLADLASPKIIGELKIPGYSTYLHPYAAGTAAEQRLIGVGYDTTVNEWGGTTNKGVKIDLYKIDYTQKDASGNIRITQEVTKTFGDEGSDSEVLNNPRLFVWNAQKKQLTMPMVLMSSDDQKQCTTTYNSAGEKIGEVCNTQKTQKTNFAGTKVLSITPTAIDEVASFDYTELLKKDKEFYGAYEEIWPWHVSSLQTRVGYLGDVFYTINNLFAHFVVPGKGGSEIYVPMDPALEE